MIMIKNLMSKKAGMSYTQIMVLIMGLFAFSYLIYNIESVDAVTNVCCEVTDNGQTCQYVPESLCTQSPNKAPTTCDGTGFCIEGCCISSNTGICNENTFERDCSGDFVSNQPLCNVQDCEKGCCTLGSDAEWITERNCEFKSANNGVPLNFTKQIHSDIQCVLSVGGDKEGACVLEEGGNCIYTTLEECYSRTRDRDDFYEEEFCSDKNTSCTEHANKGCVEDKEDVYWFDSCGNREEVAEDCNFYSGTYCGKEGRYSICKDISCQIDGRTRKNGESWCEYDDVIGKGKDPVGSRHVRHICFMGDEKIEPCSDYRNEVCVETVSSTEEGRISQSGCRTNNWRSCLSYNSNKDKDEGIKKCEENPDCHIQNVNMGKSFKFDVCLPQYPPGFDLIQEMTEAEIAGEGEGEGHPMEEICGLASKKCTEIWVCSIFGCSCKVNCGCHKNGFTQAMNDFCVSLGDCGFYVNYDGDSDEAYSVTASWKHPGNLAETRIAEMKKNAGEKPAPPGSMEFFESLSPQDLQTILPGVSGALGSALLVQILSNEFNNMSENVRSTQVGIINQASYSNNLASIAEAGVINFKLNKILGLSPGQFAGFLIAGAGLLMGSIFLMIIGLILVFILGMSIRKNHVEFKCNVWQPPVDGGSSDCEACNERLDVPCTEYRCESLGQTCELINEGTGDELCVKKNINDSVPVIKPWEYEDSENDIYIPTQGHVYTSVTNEGFKLESETGNKCIEPWTTVKWGIKVLNTNDEPQYAQCKFDMDAVLTYEEMAEYFDKDHPTSYLPYHKMDFYFPSPEAFKNQYNLTNEQIKEIGSLEFYIRCKNRNGVVSPQPIKVETCINPGPDLTPPTILKLEPPTRTYVKHNTTSQDLIVYTDEPSNCKWSLDSNKGYSDMENEMVCNTSIDEYTINGFVCATTFANITENNKFYILCQDTSENKNTLQTPIEYELLVSSSALKITSIAPEKGMEFLGSVEPFNVALQLRTTGGAEEGKAICEWEESDGYSDFFIYDDPEGSTAHTYPLILSEKEYNITFSCEDVAGNMVENSTLFTTKIDDLGPVITRVYYEGGIKIMTDEKSKCVYDSGLNIHDLNNEFRFENATVISEDVFEHVAGWDYNNYYLIQCEDGYGNKGDRISIKPYDFIW